MNDLLNKVLASVKLVLTITIAFCSINLHAGNKKEQKMPGNLFIASRAAYGNIFDDHDWFINHNYMDFDLQCGTATYKCRDDFYAHLYNYPRYGVGISYGTFSQIKMKDSYLKNIASIYGFFDRDVVRTSKFSAGYILECGLGASRGLYDIYTNPSNIFLSSPVFFYIAAGLKINVHVNRNWAIGISGRLKHHSNGRLSLPNQGINMYEIGLEARYTFDDGSDEYASNNWHSGAHNRHSSTDKWHSETDTFANRLYDEMANKYKAEEWKEYLKDRNHYSGFDFHISASGGMHKTKADWRAYNSGVDDPDRKSSSFKPYPRFSLNLESSYRYGTRFSTGISCSMYWYGGLEELKKADTINWGTAAVEKGPGYNHFVLGIGVIQEFYYKNLAVFAEIGIYPYYKLGLSNALSWNYQKGGIRYYIPKAANMFIGFAVKAIDFAESEYMELTLGFRLSPHGRKRS